MDWRNNEAIASALLPHDAVFLSRLFGNAVTSAILEAGGIECDPCAGGTVAVFGIDLDLPRACRIALSGTRRIESALSELSSHWEAEFGVMPDFAICVHGGSATIGEIGADGSRRLTAAGPAVETARRLRAVAARKGTRILLSVGVLEHAGVRPAQLQGLTTHTMPGAASPRVAALRSLGSIQAAFDA